MPRQESPLPPIRQSCELVFELATRIAAAIPYPSFPVHVTDDAPRRLQKFKAKFPVFYRLRTIAGANVRKEVYFSVKFKLEF